MIITLAFAGGFQKIISEKIFSFFGHLRVIDYNTLDFSLAEEYPIAKNDSVLSLGKLHPEISLVQAFATKNALLRTPDNIEGVLFKGVEPDHDFSHLQKFLLKGRWPRFPDSGYSQEIVLSESLANTLKLTVGDAVIVFFIQSSGQAPRPRKVQITGLYKTGIEEYDKLFVLGDLRLIRRLNNWNDDQIGGYEIFLRDPTSLEAVSRAIVPQLPWGLHALTIKEIIPSLFEWLTLQNKTTYIVLLIMIVIAVLNMVVCLLVLVLERTRMIGLLTSLGSSKGLLRKIFLVQGIILAGFGIAGGTLLGLLVCWLQARYGFIKLPEDSYYISQAAVFLEWWQVLGVIVGTLAINFMILLLPTLLVRKVSAIKALQFR
ncbi:MAG: ABC transporter permease, partial [Chitinophagaceae bacterium]